MAKKTIEDVNVQGKRVLVRVDYNVPLTPEGTVADDKRIVAALPTVKYLLEHGADPNICDNNNNDALRYFLELKVYEKDASKCSLKDLQAVVDRMTDIDRIGEGGITAIGVACDAYKLEIPSKRKAILPVLKILLNAGANPYIDNYWQYNTERLYNNMSQKDYENGITELETFFRMYTEQKQNLYQRTVAEYEYAL